MTLKEAIRLLDPKTTGEAIAEIEYYNGFSGKTAAIQAITDACEIAVEAMGKQIPKKVKIEKHNHTFCDCGHKFSIHLNDCYAIPFNNKTPYCPNCGQAIDWSNEE
ncbi:MAG: hypothetical protein U0K91_10880 [Acutalibacteraceae bacterium]|nr:hypothetical protein [Acutalibacteraceae bacterium]